MNKNSIGRAPMLDFIHDRFLCRFQKSISNALDSKASVHIVTTDLSTLGEAINSIPIPTFTTIFKIKGLGIAFLCLESKLTEHLLHLPSAGVGEKKEFVGTELALQDFFSRVALKNLQKAWKPVYATKFRVTGTNLNSQFLIPIIELSANEPVISATFEIQSGNICNTLILLYPCSTLEPIRDKLNPAFMGSP